MKDESKKVVVLLFLLVLANIVWALFAPPNPFGATQFTGRLAGWALVLLAAPLVLAYFCARDDARGLAGAALYGITHAVFTGFNYQYLSEAGGHNTYTPMLLAATAIVGILLAFFAYNGFKQGERKL